MSRESSSEDGQVPAEVQTGARRTSILSTGHWRIIHDDRYEEFRTYVRFASQAIDYDHLILRK